MQKIRYKISEPYRWYHFPGTFSYLPRIGEKILMIEKYRKEEEFNSIPHKLEVFDIIHSEKYVLIELKKITPT